MQADGAAEFFFVLNDENRFAIHNLLFSLKVPVSIHNLLFSLKCQYQSITLLFSLKWQYHVEDAPFAGGAVHANRAAVLIDDFGTDREAEADSVGFRREERIENHLEVLGIDAGAAVDHGDFDLIRRAARFHGDDPAGRARLSGVRDQVENYALHQFRIEWNRRDIGRIIFVNRDVHTLFALKPGDGPIQHGR